MAARKLIGGEAAIEATGVHLRICILCRSWVGRASAHRRGPGNHLFLAMEHAADIKSELSGAVANLWLGIVAVCLARGSYKMSQQLISGDASWRI